MLRQFFIAFVAIFYLAVTSGFAVNLHYCMGEVASVSIGHAGDHADGSCSKCGMDKSNFHCCKDEVKELKLQDSHQPVTQFLQLVSTSDAALISTPNLLLNPQGSLVSEPATYHAPPPREGNKVYRSLAVFRI